MLVRIGGSSSWEMTGAQASANLYSIIETAKANGLEPYAYLRHLFTELPKATTLESIEELLPHRTDPAQLKPPVNPQS
jgi:transposase